MKIAISCAGKVLDSMVDQRFGWAPFFIVYDQENDSFQVVSNDQNLQSAQGAGIQSAKTVVDTGVQAVITGNVGPEAYQALITAKIKIYLSKYGTVKNAVLDFKEGKLNQATGAIVEGHAIFLNR